MRLNVPIMFWISLLLIVFLSCSSSDSGGTSQTPNKTASNVSGTHSGATFAVNDTEGNMHRMEEFVGSPLILNFWGTWCPPCRRELPDLQRIYTEYKPKGLQIIGLAVNDTPEKVREFAQRNGLAWVMLMANREALQSFEVSSGVPTTVFIDRQGREVSRVIGARDYEFFKKEVAKIIN